MSDPDYSRSVYRGCKAANTIACVGDLIDIAVFKQYMESVGDFANYVMPFIKPWSKLDAFISRMDMAAATGVGMCGTDVDGAAFMVLRKAAVPVSVVSPQFLAKIVQEAHKRRMKFVVKGIMTADEAVIAADAGADAVLVSNHGGRVLDYTPGTAEVLPAIADAVGKRVVVMLDGGIRNGADVLKALALGADLTLICRPVIVAVLGDTENGLAKYFSIIREQLAQAMRLTGCGSIAAIGGQVIC
jgi:isopentenyl diphosphate isomerase/L-lactate dehydrogenase-like FMN-dependent dehydrogenase